MELSLTYADDDGAGWLAAEPPYMQRASHAVVDDGGVWLVDPVDGEGLDDILAPLGEVRGVLQLLGRHPRDCAALAARLGVPHHVTPTDGVPGLSLQAITVVDRPWWREVALWAPRTRSLIVPESLGTAPYYLTGDDLLGVHPMMRMTPPRGLAAFDAARLLPGHGAPVAGAHVAEAIRDVLDRSRRDIPRVALRLARHRGRPPATAAA